MKRVGFLCLSIFTCSLFAGEASFIGNGVVVHEPEYVTTNITVSSQCYPRPRTANLVNNEIVAEIQAYLKTKIDESNGVDAILTSGGTVQPFSRTIYSDLPREICVGTFQQTTQLTLRTKKLDEFSAVFAEIQDYVLSNFRGDTENPETPSTFVSMDSPQQHVTRATRDRMKRESIRLATEDAMHKYWAFAQGCAISTSPYVIKTTERSLHRGGFPKAKSLTYDGRAEVELNFDPLTEESEVEMVFSFPDAQITCPVRI